MNIFLAILEKVLYGTFNDQLKLQNNFAHKCEFNEIFENKIRNIGLPHYLFHNMFYHFYCNNKIKFPPSNLPLKKRKNKKDKKSTSDDKKKIELDNVFDGSFLESKYKFMIKTLTNNFISNADKNKFMDIISKCQRTCLAFSKFALICKLKRRSLGNDTDMYLNPISSNDNNVICLIHENTKYLFTINDAKKIVHQSLSNSEEMYSDPLPIKNPYNNLPFSKSNLYTLYFFIKKSNFSMPTLFHNYFQSNFCITAFYFHNKGYLRNCSMNQLINCNYSRVTQIDYIYNMIENYNLNPNINKKEQILISDDFPQEILWNAFRPFLKYYLKSEYSLASYQRIENRMIINAMLLNFKNKNPLFGRKYYVNEYDSHVNRPVFKPYFNTEFTEFEKPLVINQNYSNSHKDKLNNYARFILDYIQEQKRKPVNTHIRWNLSVESDNEEIEIETEDESEESESVS
tara:strand:+ start:716 stop:2089 length:1374 start_codon:yes stop_codon:yes gene_type:complete